VLGLLRGVESLLGASREVIPKLADAAFDDADLDPDLLRRALKY